jgi:ABC-type transport system involved in multi-copper enzyme maturation permease subunit
MSKDKSQRAVASEAAKPSAPELRPRSALSASLLICRLGLSKTLRGKLLWGCLALMALPLIAQVVVVATGNAVPDDRTGTFFRGWLTMVLPLAAILASYSGVSEEVESQTVTYLFSRPLPRWTLPVGKLATSVALLAPAAIVFFAGGALLAPDRVPSAGLLVAGVLAVAVYSSLALCAGTLVPRHAVLASLGLLALLDMGLTHVPGFTQTLTPSFHLKNLSGLLPPPSRLEALMPRPVVDPSTSTAVLLIQTLAFIGVAIIRSTFWEYRSSR